MDVLLWIGWACTLVVAFFICLIALFGSMAMRSPSWDLEFFAAAGIEFQRRGLATRTLSVSDVQSARRMTGRDDAPEPPDHDSSARIFATLQVLTGRADSAALAADIDKRSEDLLIAALIRQFRSVQNISNLNLASRIWLVYRWTATLSVLGRGLIWFLPLCFSQVRRAVERYILIATILGIAGGLLYWGFNTLLVGPGESGKSWIDFVGVVVTFGTVLALLLAVGQQFLKVLETVVGPARSWTVRGILTPSIAIAPLLAILALLRTGVWVQWQLSLCAFISHQLSHKPLGDWLATGLLVAFTILMIRRALKWALLRRLKLGDRMGALSAAIVFTLLALLLVLYSLRAPREISLPVILLFGWSVVLLGAINGVVGVVEWARKYRTLRRAGKSVRRGWFRWWAIWAWIGSSLAIGLAAFIPNLGHSVLGVWLTCSVAGAISILSLSLLVTFLPGVVTVIRFVIRVNLAHEQHNFDVACFHTRLGSGTLCRMPHLRRGATSATLAI